MADIPTRHVFLLTISNHSNTTTNQHSTFIGFGGIVLRLAKRLIFDLILGKIRAKITALNNCPTNVGTDIE